MYEVGIFQRIEYCPDKTETLVRLQVSILAPLM